MAEADEFRQRLLMAQSADGGWAFSKVSSSSSWTEPTALALLSFTRSIEGTSLKERDSKERALGWLLRRQNSDGGWSPNEAVPISTWVTSVAILAIPKVPDHRNCLEKANEWLIRAVKPELSVLRQLLVQVGIAPAKAPGGAPWFPGTAGWVTPTAMSLLALSQMADFTKNAAMSSLVKESQSFLLSHRCPDGGWNHGGSLFRSENSTSYPETTGLALLALSGVPSDTLHTALRLSETLLSRPGSLEGLSWLQMGLRAHGRNVTQSALAPEPRTARDIALRLLAIDAAAGSNSLLRTS